MNDSKLGFLPAYISWTTIVLAVLTIVTLIAVSDTGRGYPIYSAVMDSGYGGGTAAVPPSAAAPMMRDKGGMYYPYPSPEVPASDMREFLKTYYNASLLARDVPGLTARVVTVVRAHDGRIDQETSSSEYGYVSFALSQTTYNAFRSEIERLVGKRFLTVNISSQNLLSQKVSIEEQQKQADEALAEYKAAKQKIISAHANATRMLEAQISSLTAKLATLEAEPSTPALLIRIQAANDELAALKQQLASENASYAKEIEAADANIKYGTDWQKAVKTQDETLLKNVGTVSGTISIQKINLWDTLLLYLPGYWVPTILAVLTFLSYRRDQRRRFEAATE